MKDLLIVYNIFTSYQVDNYFKELDSIFWNIEENSLQENVRVVVSSVCSQLSSIIALKERYKEKLTIFSYVDRWPVQVSCNKTIFASIKEFNEEYNGYLYISAGIVLPKIKDLLPKLLQKLNSDQYGIIHLQLDNDNGYNGLGKPWEQQAKVCTVKDIDFSKDYDIPIGNFCGFNVTLISKSIKDFYEKPITDVHGKCSMEIGLSYISYAIRKKYILLGNSECHHVHRYDSIYKGPDINCGLLWGRDKSIFLNDKEGIEAGLGYYAGSVCNFPIDGFGTILPHNRNKYDENYFSNDPRLKYAVKRCYFTNTGEIDYMNIKYTIIK